MAGTADGIALLSEFSGLERSEIRSIWDEVSANKAKLDRCPRHAFEPATPGDLRRRRCRTCTGFASATAAHWYEQGLKHGGG